MALFVQHYRQPIGELSALAFYEGLRDIGPDELDAACKRALETSEFMPVVATIRHAVDELRSLNADREEYLGVPLLAYPEITAEEREEALKFSAALRQKLLLDTALPLQKEQPKPRPVTEMPSHPQRPLTEQVKELERKGFLSGEHSPKCLCPKCQERRVSH